MKGMLAYDRVVCETVFLCTHHSRSICLQLSFLHFKGHKFSIQRHYSPPSWQLLWGYKLLHYTSLYISNIIIITNNIRNLITDVHQRFNHCLYKHTMLIMTQRQKVGV